jgi:ACS family hexuronate transporter-like MFS transporter
VSSHSNASEYASPKTWWLCGFLFLATVLNYVDRQVLALTAEKVIAEFSLTKEAFGEVIAAFRYSYGAVQIAGGWLVDRYGPRIVYPLAVGLWPLAGVLTASATSVRMLSGFRFLLGIGEAFNWPSALKVTHRLLSARDRPLANGIFNSGAAVGAMLAPVIVTATSMVLGWRAAFVVTGSLGSFWIVGWLWYTRKMSSQLGGSVFSLRDVFRVMAGIVCRRNFWMLAFAAILVNGVSFFLADWIPLYLKTERGFSFAAGNALSVLVYGSLEVGNITVGLFVRRLIALGLSVQSARNRALFVSCVLMSAGTIVGLTSSPLLAIGCLLFVALGVASFLVIYHTLVQDLEPSYVGTSSGLLGGLGNMAYGYLSPHIGRLSDLNETALTFLLIGLLPWMAYFAIARGMKAHTR